MEKKPDIPDPAKNNTKEDAAFLARMQSAVSTQIVEAMEAKRKIDRIERGLRDLDCELRGRLQGGHFWCCANPDIKITIDPMETGIGGLVTNHGVYNNYKCNNCGKTWVEQVSSGPGYASQASIEEKEIEDYHTGYIKRPKMRCPICHNAGFHIVIVNHDKQPHEYELWCLNCNFKERRPFDCGFLEKISEPSKDSTK